MAFVTSKDRELSRQIHALRQRWRSYEGASAIGSSKSPFRELTLEDKHVSVVWKGAVLRIDERVFRSTHLGLDLVPKSEL
jgi:hypothetical protein